jgi:hypothetical protein
MGDCKGACDQHRIVTIISSHLNLYESKTWKVSNAVSTKLQPTTSRGFKARESCNSCADGKSDLQSFIRYGKNRTTKPKSRSATMQEDAIDNKDRLQYDRRHCWDNHGRKSIGQQQTGRADRAFYSCKE